MLLLLLSVLAALSVGSASLTIGRVWAILLHQLPLLQQADPPWTALEEAIVTQVRLSRVMLALAVGACLALAGAGFQGVLRNPLADPYTLGVASGSSVGAAFLILFGLQGFIGMWSIPVVAFATGMITLLGVFWLTREQGRIGIETLILSGVVMQAFLSAFVSYMVSISQGGVINEILFWLMGSLANRNWQHVALLVPFLGVALPLLLYFARALNLFVLGERQAEHLGVRVERTKLLVLIVCTMLTAAAVSVSGVIGFVGLVVPHMLRLLVGPDYRLLIPLSALGGGIYVLWADTLARTLTSPRELQLGIVTAFIGAPFFAYLLKRRKSGLTGGREAS